MSGNQEPRISLPTWRYSDFNAAIPIKKRKYFVLPQPPAVEEANKHHPKPYYEQGDTSVAEKQKQTMNVGVPTPLFPSVSLGNAGKAETFGDKVGDTVRVKVEEVNFPIHSAPLAGFGIASGSNLFANSLRSSLGKLRGGAAEYPGAVVPSGDPQMRMEHTLHNTNDIVRRESLIEASAGVAAESLQLNSSPFWENKEPTSLNLSLNEGVCAPHNADSASVSTKPGNYSGVNRSNWDLNTTMDDWEDVLDRKTRVKTSGAFLNETSSCFDTTDISKSVSGKQKESVGFRSPTGTSMLLDHQLKPICSLSLGLSSYHPIEKSSSVSATTSETRPACTGFSRPLMIPGNVNFRTVKSEVIEETISQETESAQTRPIGLSINRLKQEVTRRFSQENIPSSDVLKPVVKSEPNNFTQSEIFRRRDGLLNHPHAPRTQPSEILDLPSTSTPNQKDTYIPYSNAPISLNGIAINPGVPGDSGVQNLQMIYSCSGNEHHNLNASGVNVTTLTSEKNLDDCQTGLPKELSHRGTDELSIKGNDGVDVGCGGSETEQRVTDVPFHLDSRNTNCVEKGSQPAELGNTGNTYSKECSASSSFKKYTVDYSYSKMSKWQALKVVQIKRLTSELQSRIFDGSGENEGREQSTQQKIHASEGVSGVSTLTGSGGNVENMEVVDNNSPDSYKAEISAIDNESPAEYTEGTQSRIINLAQVSNKSPIETVDASDSFAPLQMERDSFEPRKYFPRGSDESSNFSNGRYQRRPRLNFMPDGRRFDQTESNLHDRNTKSFKFHNNRGNNYRGNAFRSNFHRGIRQPGNDVGSNNSYPRRSPGSYNTHRGQSNKEDASTFHGFRDGEDFSKESQCNNNNTEPMFTSPPRTYQGRNTFTRGRAKYLNYPKRDFPGFRSRSPVRSRERSPGPSSSFRNRSQEEFSGHADFSNRRSSPSGYRKGMVSSPDQSGYQRETDAKTHNSPPYSHRPLNPGRGRGYSRGRGFVRGRGYGRDGNYFRKPYDRIIHRNHGSLNNLDPRERADHNNYSSDNAGRFGVDVNVERRQFGYRHDDTGSFRPPFSDDGGAATNVDPDAVRYRQEPDIETQEQRSVMEIDGQNQNSIENTSSRNKGTQDEEPSKWQQDESGGEGLGRCK